MIGGMMKKELVNALGRYPVFSVRDISGALGRSREYAYLAAYRLKKAGAIREIEKGKYTLLDDPLAIASWIVWPSYISCWAALSFHRLTDQLPFTIHVVTTRKRKRKILTFGNARIEFIRVKASAFFGFRRSIYQGNEIFVAEKEKAIVDALAARKMSFGEALEIIKGSRRRIRRRRLLSYAKAFRGMGKKLRGAFR
jgi:predicted transcriptional regulator of viral defense system